MQYSSEVVPLKSFKTTVKLFVEIVDPHLLRIASRCAFVTVQIDLSLLRDTTSFLEAQNIVLWFLWLSRSIFFLYVRKVTKIFHNLP